MSRHAMGFSKSLNWDASALDYARYRPGYPASFFELVRCFGIGRPAQRILDLGAGTGALALEFARQGASVVALDVSQGQLDCLKKTAQTEGLSVDILHGRAEESGLPSSSFEAITASMCWGYFNQDEMNREVPRLLTSGGRLLVSSIVWTADDPISMATDRLLAKLNPASCHIPEPTHPRPSPQWITPPFSVIGFHTWIEDIPFTRQSWRGRIRASKWIGAALEPAQVADFDRAHDEALRAIGLEEFLIPHRITVHVLSMEGKATPKPPRNWFKRLIH